MKLTLVKSVKSILADWGFSKEGFLNNKNGEWWLIIQILLIFLHFVSRWPSLEILGLSSWPILFKIVGALLIVIGILIATISLLNLGKSLSPLPEPKANAVFINAGLYKKTRHPLYLSLLIISIGINIAIGSLIHIALFILLSMTLISKAKREEIKLMEKYAEYTQYMLSTPAIIRGLMAFDWRELNHRVKR